jgi:hypothetical protein
MEIHFWNREIYPTYAEAKAAGALHECDAPAHEDEFHRYGWRGGALADAMQALVTALTCLNVEAYLDAVLVDGENIYHWGDENHGS